MAHTLTLLPDIGITETLFDGYKVDLTETEGATFKYCNDACQYRFRYHVYLVWQKIESYSASVTHLVKTGKIMTHAGIEAANDLNKVVKAEALTMQVPPGDKAVFFSLSRILHALNRNMPHEKSKRFDQWRKTIDVIELFTLKYKQS